MQCLKGWTALVIAVVACLGALSARATAQAVARPTRILLLYAPAPDSPTAAMFIERFRTTVRTELPPPVEFYEEFLDFDRFQTPDRWPLLTRYFRDKYKGFPIDLVVCVGSVALRFETEQLRPLFPNVPVVFGLTFAHRVNLADLPTNVTGRVITVSLGQTLTMARLLQPDANRIVVIGGSSAIDSIAIAGALSSLRTARDSQQVVLRQGWPLDSLRAELRGLSRRTIVFVAHFRRDGTGQLFVPLDAITAIARESRAPVYGYQDKMMGTGVVGGAMLRQDDEASLTGQLAVRILRRAPGQPIPPVEVARTSFIVDWRQLRRWKLAEQRLPPGTEIMFRTPTAWERYRGPILAGLGIIAAESLLIGLLLLERRKRRLAQAALAEQAEYERTMAELTTLRHARADTPGALEDALSCIGRYAGAHAVVLIQHSDSAARPPTRLQWTRESGAHDGNWGLLNGHSVAADLGGSARNGNLHNGNGARLDARDHGTSKEFRLGLPLVVGGKSVGVLELYRSDPAGEWPPHLAARLGAAGDLFAGAIARANAAMAADEASRQLAHLGRVAMVGELTAAISHELRQPLTAIRTNAEVAAHLLQRPEPDIEEARQVLRDIVADDLRAAEVIDHIRMLLRKEEPVSAAVDLNEIARHATLLVERDARTRGVRLSLALEPELPAVLANAAEMHQVVLNLVLNAFDALAGHRGPREVVIGTSKAEDWVELSVRDTGPGFTPATRARIFESFFSTKTHGLGLGLTIARSIVERYRGRVIAENSPVGGAVFRVILPATSGGVHAPAGSHTDEAVAL